ncbi:3-oxoacyl-ACP reductase FabG [Synechococcus sp. GFB01]|uniref:3-oxoacyl-ACP reductase FabG n=1 Tax=Synechococcus sp. GFB01 TaxID=1662190 RepID=UPI000B1E2DB7|nr:3-oxoacyl-ACP reductase FabG [Synechococcus sp. GFB01]
MTLNVGGTVLAAPLSECEDCRSATAQQAALTMSTGPLLQDQTAVVTGGSRGIGRSIVLTLASQGAKVTFLYCSNQVAADHTLKEAADLGLNVEAKQVDVRDAAACEEAVEEIAEQNDKIDILVNSAGIIRDNILGLLSKEDVEEVLTTNVIGVFNILRPVIPFMVSRRKGKIINISSVAGEKGGRGQTNYAASKGAINALTKALAVELAPRNIRVNCVAPGVIETEMSETIRQQAGDVVQSRILLGRFGQPEDVANAVLFFASGLSDYITGQVLHVDGGFKMS